MSSRRLKGRLLCWWAIVSIGTSLCGTGIVVSAVYAGTTKQPPVTAVNGSAEMAPAAPGDISWPLDSEATLSKDSAVLRLSSRVHRRSAARLGRPQVSQYQVQSGDSLWSIANRFETDISTLVALNPDATGTFLLPGQTLQVARGFRGVVLRLQEGDTLERVAAKYGVSPQEIARTTGISSELSLPSGDWLFLPGARPRNLVTSRGTSRLLTVIQPAEISRPTDWVWPIADSLYYSEFGYREDGFHRGLDIAAAIGTPAGAVQAGVVLMAGWNGGYGYCVVLEHAGGIQTLYAHASRILVQVGDVVRQGEPVILVGNTGKSTGPHLHLEVLIDGKPVNPRAYLP